MGAKRKKSSRREVTVLTAKTWTDVVASSETELTEDEVMTVLCENIREEVVQVVKTMHGNTLFRDRDGFLYRAVTMRELATLPPLELLMLGQLSHVYDQEHELYLFCVFGPNMGTVGSSAWEAVKDAFEKRDREAYEQAGALFRKFGRRNN
jgi:hypothetical protein